MNDNVFIIAEISANHGHDINIVKETMLKAREIGCDAVKIQTYKPDSITLDCDNEYFQINNGTIWDGTTLYKLYEEAFLPWEWHKELFDFAREQNIVLFSTPFDSTAVDLLEECGNPIYKIASFEVTDIPLIEYAAAKGKPMIISTGIATEEEIGEVVEACKRMGNDDVTLLKCTSQYPAKIEDANLLTMPDMGRKFECKVGLSDHTEGDIVPITATALGAKVIEKHFILDKEIGGPDASFSMNPEAFGAMIQRVREAEKALGNIDYSLSESKMNSRKYARSLFVSSDAKAGDRITKDNIKSVRPSDGLAPKYYDEIIGKKFKRDVKKGNPLNWEIIGE